MAKMNGAGTKEAAAGGAQVTFLEAIRQAMFEEMERDPAVVLLGEDVGVYGGAFKTSEGLLARFGWERVMIRRSAKAPSSARPAV
jgi:2-oxoisovalerate dehydrogenase E1 component beta subunit